MGLDPNSADGQFGRLVQVQIQFLDALAESFEVCVTGRQQFDGLGRRDQHARRVACEVAQDGLRREVIAMLVRHQDQVDVVEGRFGLLLALQCFRGRCVGVVDRLVVEDGVDEDLLGADLDEEALVGDVGDLRRGWVWRGDGQSRDQKG